MIELEATKEGVLLGVQVSAGASRSRVMGEHGGRLKVSVSAAPERGKANEAVVKVLAEALGVKRAQVTIVRGETSRQKTVLMRGMSVEEIAERVRNATEKKEKKRVHANDMRRNSQVNGRRS